MKEGRNISLLALLFISALFVSCGKKGVVHKSKMTSVPEVPKEQLDKAYSPRRIALLVGIDHFTDSKWRKLSYAEKDAREFGKILKTANESKNQGFDSVKILTSTEETRRESILENLKKINQLNTDPRDIVVVYFSTHGTLDREKDGELRQYLVTSDTDYEKIPETALDIAGLRDWFQGLRSRKKVLILATCHSGHGKSELNKRMERELSRTKAKFFVKPIDVVSEASVVLSACAWGETAREDEKLKHDIYTYFFLEALAKFDPNGDGAVTVSEAHDYAKEKTYYYTRGQQRPAARSDILGSDPIVLAGRIQRAGKPVIYSYDESLGEITIKVNGREKGKLPGSVVLPPGKHEIALARPGSDKPFFTKKVRFMPGERISARKYVEFQTVERDIGVGAAYRSFFSPDVNDAVAQGTVTYGAKFRRTGPFKNTRLSFGLSGGQSSGNYEINDEDEDVKLTRLDADAGLFYRYRRKPWEFGIGPVAGLNYFHRKVLYDSGPETEGMLTGSGQLAGNMGLMMFDEWRVSLGGSIGVTPISVNSTLYYEPDYSGSVLISREF